MYRPVGSWGSDAGDDVWHYNTFTLDQQHLGEQTTVRITVTMSSFSDLFSLFGGGEETEERVVAVDNVLIQGMETANLVVHDVSVSPQSVNSGASVKVRYSVKNAGTADASKGNVFVYRHRSRTDTPATGGTRVSTFAMQSSLAPGVGFSRAANVRTLSVSDDTVIYYYVCVDAADGEAQIDDNCGSPVTVTVKAKVVETPEPEVPVETPTEEPGTDNQQVVSTPTEDYTETSYPEPPYESCYHSPERKHVMAGDAMLPRPLKGKIRDRTGVYSCSTITLGGVETRDGTKGFVVSGHGITDIDAAGKTKYIIDDQIIANGILIGHGKFMKSFDIGRLLGKVSETSNIRNEGNKKVLGADAAFVAYPRLKTSGCSLTWRSNGETFCLDLGGDQIERVAPMKIRGKGEEVYTVIGSQEHKKGVEVWFTGAVSGVVDKNLVTSGRKVLTYGSEEDLYRSMHTIPVGTIESYDDIDKINPTRKGDSGAPIYTVPDENGNTRIVGILSGRGIFGAGTPPVLNVIFSSWDDVTEALDLEPIY